MALHDDLLEQARHLSTREIVGPPRQASLRRAVSAAYYSLFHLFVAEASSLLPANPPGLRGRVSRAFVHDEMKAVCKAIAASAPAATTAAILSPQKFSSQLRDVAKVFSDLQDARHRADYDLSEKFTRTQTLSFVWQAEFAFLTWNLIRNRDEARVFLAALLLQKRWSR